MKRIVFSILFIFAVVWGWNTMERCVVPMDEQKIVERSETSEATQHVDQTISVLTAANSCADVSVRPSTSFSTNFVRRYRPAGFALDRMFEYLTEDQDNSLANALKTTKGFSQEYAARLKTGGYYIYTLRKIII